MQLIRRRLAPQETDHELIWLLVSLGGVAGLIGWLAARLPVPPCTFHSLTGLPCLTCGATRSAWQFLHGNLTASFRFNPLAFASYCGILLFDLYAAAVVLSGGRRWRVSNFSQREKWVLRSLAIMLLAGNWVYLLSAHMV